jgi:hypothetical protein
VNTTITKAVIAAIAAFGTLVQAKMPVDTNQWIQIIAEALGTGAVVWYVPNTPKSGGSSQ